VAIGQFRVINSETLFTDMLRRTFQAREQCCVVLNGRRWQRPDRWFSNYWKDC